MLVSKTHADRIDRPVAIMATMPERGNGQALAVNYPRTAGNCANFGHN
jgi:hypothetical protein